MTGPKDIIRRASMQHRQEDRTPAERVPAPAPMQVRQAPFVQPAAQMRTSGAMERQMPPLSTGFKENARAAAPETGEPSTEDDPAEGEEPEEDKEAAALEEAAVKDKAAQARLRALDLALSLRKRS